MAAVMFPASRAHVAGSEDEHEMQRAYGGELSIWP